MHSLGDLGLKRENYSDLNHLEIYIGSYLLVNLLVSELR